MNISHDRESGALYIRLRGGKYDHTEDFSEQADVYLDVDRDGNVLGLEALSFEDLAQAVEERGGKLDVPERVGNPSAADPGPDPEELRKAIYSLGREDREILQLLVGEEMNIVKVAERLGVSLVEAQRARSSAYAKLNDALRGSGREPEGGRSIEDDLSTLRP